MTKILGVLALCLFVISAGADETSALFEQDPLCSSPDFFKKDYDAVSAVHRASPQLRAAYDAQSRWFKAVSGDMSGFCEADKKFATEVIAKVPADLSGQCKPVEEAALRDQAVLEHSAGNLKALGTKRDNYFTKGLPGVADPLLTVADKDMKLVRDYALTLEEVPFTAFCELKWTYPDFFWKSLGLTDIAGCPPLKAFDQPGSDDKKSPSLFGRLATRYNLSVTYNARRYGLAAAAAKASGDRYLSCVAQFPEVKPNKLLTGPARGEGSGTPSGAHVQRGSDITGTEQDKKKQQP